MTEEATFDKLRRCTLEQMTTCLEQIVKLPPVMILGNKHCDIHDYYPTSMYYSQREKCFKDNGWTGEDYYYAKEKEAVIQMVDAYNESIQFPKEVIERAKRIFPNITFTEAKITIG